MILQPPFPMREPHWLAGTTIRRVTGGLLVAVLFVIELLMSWRKKKTQKKTQFIELVIGPVWPENEACKLVKTEL